MAWSPVLNKLPDAGVGTAYPSQILSWLPPTDTAIDSVAIGYNNLPVYFDIVPNSSGATVSSANVLTAWDYLDIVYTTDNGETITHVPNHDMTLFPAADPSIEPLAMIYDPTPFEDFYFSLQAHWTWTNPVPAATPATKTGVNTMEYFITVVNNFTGNHGAINNIMTDYYAARA
ncbi:MAG: hypothetical protein R8M45_03875 [Ghiorsea sp.]